MTTLTTLAGLEGSGTSLSDAVAMNPQLAMLIFARPITIYSSDISNLCCSGTLVIFQHMLCMLMLLLPHQVCRVQTCHHVLSQC